MRLQPLDPPPNLLGRLLAFLSRRHFGKVITPMRVVYNRVPAAYQVAFALARLQRSGFRLDLPTRLLVMSWVAMINRCGFCVDIARAEAVSQHVGLDKFNALPDYASHPAFDERERAALAFVEEVTRERKVSDATFERLRAHFTEREIVELTLVNAIENFYNLVNLPLGIEEDGLCALALERA